MPPDLTTPTRSGTAVDLRGVRRIFAGGVIALDGIDLHLAPGEFVALLGLDAGCMQQVPHRTRNLAAFADHSPHIVLGYFETSLLAHCIRDEIREVAPGLYLGKVYWGKKRLIDFAIEFPK